MAKERYYSTKMMESREEYVGLEASRTLQMQDGGMIRANPAEIANLPQEVMIKRYEMAGSYLPEVLDDKISGVDRQIDLDDSKRNAGFRPKKV